MPNKKLTRKNCKLTEQERARHAPIREAAEREYPPKSSRGGPPSPPGIPAQIRAAREAQGLNWYALARKAGVPNQATVRDIERGSNVRLSNLQAVASALGLHLELVHLSR